MTTTRNGSDHRVLIATESQWSGSGDFRRVCDWVESLTDEQVDAVIAVLLDGTQDEIMAKAFIQSMGGESRFLWMLTVRTLTSDGYVAAS